MRCSKCGFENPDGMKFCGQCTNPLALICPKCRFENPPGFKFCGQCTTPLAASETKTAPSIQLGEAAVDIEVVEGERKTVTAQGHAGFGLAPGQESGNVTMVSFAIGQECLTPNLR